MNRYIVAAGALLLGSSALALAADTQSVDKVAVDTSIHDTKLDYSKSVWADWEKDMLTANGTVGKLAWSDLDGAKDPAFEAKLESASHEGMGGPYEPVADQTGDDAIADHSDWSGVGGPAEAASNYPPCDPGPGDDRCIQLYEPGVRAELASWNNETGGLADGSATNAVGGPYEPVETSEVAIADHSVYPGVGGPAEAASGYPPCDPGPGDDRCIQLYEPGVTGAGN